MPFSVYFPHWHRPLRDVVLPLGVPIKGINGKEINALPIPKGTHVYVSIISSNRNPELWGPDAHEWKPERWLNPLPESLINAHISGVYSHLWVTWLLQFFVL